MEKISVRSYALMEASRISSQWVSGKIPVRVLNLEEVFISSGAS